VNLRKRDCFLRNLCLKKKETSPRKSAMLKEETAVKVLSVVAICNKIIVDQSTSHAGEEAIY